MTIKAYLPYYKRNLKVAFPVMLTQLGAAMVGLFDSMMVGHYSTVDLAAVSFSNAIFFTVMVFAMGAVMGITPLVGQEVGKEHNGNRQSTQKIANYLQNGIIFTSLIALLMVLLLGICIPFIDHFGQEPEVAQTAVPYFTLIVISIIPFLFFCLEKQFLEGLGNTLVAMVITLAMNLLNIFLNWILIFGHLGFPAMGATGAGIATLISRILMPLCFALVILFKKEWRHYLSLFSRQHFSRHYIALLTKIGLPIGLQSLLEAFIFTFSFILIGWISKEALAAHQIANQIADMTFMLAVGIGSATTIRVSHQLGKGDIQAVKMASQASIHLVLLMNTIGVILMVTLRNFIPYWFTEDEQVVTIARDLILMAAIFQYADGMQCVGAGMLRGITDVRRPMVYAFVAYILIALPIGIICMFSFEMGAMGMWVGFIIGLALAAVLFHTRFRKKMEKLEQKFVETK